MQRVAAKLAVEILVGFEQHNIDAASRQQQCQHRARRTGTDDAAGRIVEVADLVVRRLLHWCEFFYRRHPSHSSARGLIRRSHNPTDAARLANVNLLELLHGVWPTQQRTHPKREEND